MNDLKLLLPLLSDEKINLDDVALMLRRKDLNAISKLHYLWFWCQAGCKPEPKLGKGDFSAEEHLSNDAGLKLLYIWLWHKAGRKPGVVSISYREIGESLGCCNEFVFRLLVGLKNESDLIDFSEPISKDHQLAIYVYQPLPKQRATT